MKKYSYQISFDGFYGIENLKKCYLIHVFGWGLNNRVVTQTDINGEDWFNMDENDDRTDGYIYAANDVAIVVNGQNYNNPYKIQKMNFYYNNFGPYQIPTEKNAFWVANRLQETYEALNKMMGDWFTKHPLFTVENLPDGKWNNNEPRNHNWVNSYETRNFPNDNNKRIVVIYPQAIGGDVPWVNPTGHFTSEQMPSVLVPPNIYEKQKEYGDLNPPNDGLLHDQQHLLGHELSHAIHWFYLPYERRNFGLNYVTGGGIGHRPGKQTSELVAYLEGFADYAGYLTFFIVKNGRIPSPTDDLLYTMRTLYNMPSQSDYKTNKNGAKDEGAIAMFLFNDLYNELLNNKVLFPLKEIFDTMVNYYPQPLSIYDFGRMWKEKKESVLPYIKLQSLAASWGISLL